MNPASVECSICLGKYHWINKTTFMLHKFAILTFLTCITTLNSETFQPPIRVTNCGHSFCEQCIVPAYPAPGWRCPMCNQVHDKAAATLARNYFAEQIVNSFKAQSTPAPRRSGGEFGLCTLHDRNIEICKLELKGKNMNYLNWFRLHKTFTGSMFAVCLRKDLWWCQKIWL